MSILYTLLGRKLLTGRLFYVATGEKRRYTDAWRTNIYSTISSRTCHVFTANCVSHTRAKLIKFVAVIF